MMSMGMGRGEDDNPLLKGWGEKGERKRRCRDITERRKKNLLLTAPEGEKRSRFCIL